MKLQSLISDHRQYKIEIESEIADCLYTDAGADLRGEGGIREFYPHKNEKNQRKSKNFSNKMQGLG